MYNTYFYIVIISFLIIIKHLEAKVWDLKNIKNANELPDDEGRTIYYDKLKEGCVPDAVDEINDDPLGVS